ncbi:MAG TPA: response regulator [Oligoflexus sp.]|uniref:response regulator n=1 Tax=Oligoflexus sp. TaxID=1971216 RepID=UPI002D80F3C7|nr:response regulator [Oligoflexus sp.]HET9239881.1 response regulator [Oligoflexus sp.]
MTTVLLVDDSKFTCNRTIEMLREIDPDVNVIPAYLPSKALELVQSQGSTYDLAIIDFNMPEMNGLELAEKIRAIIPYERIVILTASSAFTTHSQTIPEGMHFCQKPVNEEKLRAVLQFQRRISA